MGKACELIKHYGPLAGRVLMLVLFTIPATIMFHNFWAADAAQYQNQLNHFLKNVSMIGGLLYMMAFGAGPLSLDHGKGEG